jgi:hypothetical protein
MFDHLNIPNQWKHEWTKYPEGYTILEALISWVNQVNNMVDNQNDLSNKVTTFRGELDDFINQFDNDLTQTVETTLSEWQQSGYLDVVIDAALQTQIDDVEARVEQTEHKLEGTINVAEYGIISDGETDQTAELVALFTNTFANARGEITIPYSTKFDIIQVYASLPSGIVLKDNSAVNFYDNVGGYRQKMITIGSNDKPSDDTAFNIMSGHHPALILNNIGTSETSPGNVASILFANGIKENKSHFTGFMQQHSVKSDKFNMAWRLQHYATDPTTVVDTTIFEFNEDGHFGVGGGATSTDKVRIVNGPGEKITRLKIENRENDSMSIHVFQSKDSFGNVKLKSIRLHPSGSLTLNNIDGSTIVSFDDDGTIMLGSGETLFWKNISGATPSAVGGKYFIVNNTSPTIMTDLVSNGRQKITLMFQNANTTLQHGNFRLKGGVDWTPAIQSSITLVKTPLTSAWVELSRTEM